MTAPESAVRFSAVIPAYNREGTIARAIESVLAQEHSAREIIVVDDGSQDGTRVAIEAFGDKVRYVHQENAGPSVARNLGVEVAQEEWIAFLDSDDFWLPGHLERMAHAIVATGGEAGVYFADTRCTPERGSELLWDAAGFAIEGDYELTADASAWAMLSRQPMMMQSSVFRRSAYLDVGGLDAALWSRHDTHLFLVMGLGRPMCAVAGCATEMTSDDSGGGRVTAAYGTQTPTYWMDTFLMYRDLLGDKYAVTAEHRSTLKRRLAGAQLRLAELARNDGKLVEWLGHLLGAFANSPRRVFGGIGRKLGLAR